MDILEFASSDDEEVDAENNSNNGGGRTENSTTDHSTRKSKLIRKHYEPIRDGGVVVRYEDDPAEYKKLRKKIQNRESAARIRGRKKGTMECLETEVDILKKENSELQLRNASLETENNSLKNEIGFLRGLIQNQGIRNVNQNNGQIDQYLNLSPKKESTVNSSDFQSPFEEDSAMQWVRESYSSGIRTSNWSTLFVMTMVICVFVLPSDPSSSDSMLAQQTEASKIEIPYTSISFLMTYGKQILKYLLLVVYVFFTGAFLFSKYEKKRKMKVVKRM